MSSRVKVVVTGAAGQIAYSLIPRLVDGKTFGDRTVDLCLVEIPQVVSKLKGLVMELEDSYFPHMGEVTYTDNFEEASHDADWFLLVGSIPRGIVYEGKKIEERSDLLKINGGIFVNQGKAIGNNAKDNAKILVVGNPANTNALIGKNASGKDTQLWMAMTMLDALRAKAQLSQKLDCHVDDIYRLAIFGNHSPTMFPDLENTFVAGKNAYQEIDDHEWVENDFLPKIQQRGAEIIKARGASSASSAARAACDTVKAVEHPTRSGDVFNAAVMSDGAYGMPKDIFSGFPLISDGKGSVEIVRDFSLSDFAKKGLEKTANELVEERDLVKDLI